MASKLQHLDAVKNMAVFPIWNCKICGNNLRVPKQLPCLHAFCKSCVENYLHKNILDRTQKIDVSCPECNFTVDTLKDSKGINTFVDHLPPDIVTSTILSSKLEKLAVCSFVNNCERQATSWCGHCAIPVCDNHHELHYQTTISKQPHDVVPINQRKDLIFPYESCRYHPDEKASFLCFEDLTLCCKLCRKTIHAPCDRVGQGVKSISGAACGIKNSKLFRDLKPLINEIENEAILISSDRQMHLDRLDKQLKVGKKEIKNIRQTIDSHLDALETDMNRHLETGYQIHTKTEQEDKDGIDALLRKIRYYKQMFKCILNRSNDVQAVSELVALKDRIQTVQDEIKSKKQISESINFDSRIYPDPSKYIQRIGYVRKREVSVIVD